MNLKNKCNRTGAYVLIDNLVQNGVEHIFGYPGGAILPIYDELYHWEKNNFIKHILGLPNNSLDQAEIKSIYKLFFSISKKRQDYNK